MKMKPFFPLTHAGIAVLAVSLAGLSGANAATFEWTGATNVTWSTGSNWTGTNPPPANNLTSDIARFNQATYTSQPTADNARQVAGLEFGSSSGAVNITTQTTFSRLALGSSGVTMESGSAAVSLGTSANQGVNLGASQTWTNNSASLLDVWRVENLTNTTPYTLTISGSGAGGTNLRLLVNNGQSDSTPGTVSLTVNTSGAGVTTLAGFNTFTGDTTLTSGILALNNGNALNRSALNTAGTGTVTTNVTALTIGGLKGSRNLADVITTGHNNLNALTLNPLSGTSTYSGVIANGTNARSLTKVGAGTQVLEGNNTYTGSTTVSGGTLLINGSGSIGGSGVTVNSGGTLGGTGTVTSLVTVNSGGTLSPGNSPGLAIYDGGLTLATGSNFTFELTANTADLIDRGAHYDGVDVTDGTFTLQSGVNFNLTFDGFGSSTDFTSAFWESDQSWLVFDNANIPTIDALFTVGTISTDSLGQNFSLTGGEFSFFQSDNDVYLSFTAIPEPSTWLLVACSLTLAIALRKRKAV